MTAIDWSAGGDRNAVFTMSTDQANNLVFADAATGVQIPVAASLKDTKWATQTTWLNWASQGLHPARGSGEAIRTTDRAPSGRTVAVGDNFGRVKLANWPTYEHGHGSSLYRGHAGPLARARWAAGPPDEGGPGEETHLITTGADDR